MERPARREHGDWSSNVALVTAKAAGRNPRELAGQLAEILNASPPPHVTSVEVAGPGFVNFHLADSWLHDVLGDVVDQGVDGYARLALGRRGAGQRRVRERQSRPDRSTPATAAARPMAIRWPACSSGPATRWPARTT